MERVANAATGWATRPRASRAVLLAAALFALLASGVLALALHPSGTATGAGRVGAASPLTEGYGPGYWAVPLAGGALAASPAQHLNESYGNGGVTLHHGAASVSLRVNALAGVHPRTQLNHITYTAPGITQWFANSPGGVEQNFTIARPVNGAATATVNMTLGGNTAATLSHGRIVFSRHGSAQLRYGHLAVRDATGRRLPAHLALTGRHLQIAIDARGASYPLHVDPVFETEEGTRQITISEAGTAEVGASVSVSADGRTAIVGAPHTSYLPGAAWILYRLANRWYQGTALVNPNTRSSETEGCSGSQENELEEAECSFGIAVAMSENGKIVAVGSPQANEERGEVLLYERVTTDESQTWRRVGRLTAENAKRLTRFGRSVALSEDGSYVAVGAPSAYNVKGAAWVYKRSEGGAQWVQVEARNEKGEEISPTRGRLTGGAGDIGEGRLGRSIAISADGKTVVVGAPGVAVPGKWHGAAFAYKLSGEGEEAEYKLTPGSILSDTNEAGEERFGVSVAIAADGSTILVGARTDDSKAGAAFVFAPSGEGWEQQGEKLQAHVEEGPEGEPGTNVESLSQFGYSVALSGNGNTALIGGPTTGKFTGAAWVFTREELKWKQVQRLEPTGTLGKVWFGDAVALSADGSSALVGGEAFNGGSGAVWAYLTGEALKVEEEVGSQPEREKEQHELEEQEKVEKEHLEEINREEELRLKEEELERLQKKHQEEEETKSHQSKAGVQGNILGVKGTVTIEQPKGSHKFVTITGPLTVQNGSVINATEGSVTLELEGAHGKKETVVLHGGEFEIEQQKNGFAFFTLKGGNPKCPKGKSHTLRHGRASAARRHHRPYRRLWVEGHGKFASKGSYASGAVLGTRWETLDSCEGTEIVVITDKVLVTNLRTHKKFIVKAGHHKFIRA